MIAGSPTVLTQRMITFTSLLAGNGLDKGKGFCDDPAISIDSQRGPAQGGAATLKVFARDRRQSVRGRRIDYPCR